MALERHAGRSWRRALLPSTLTAVLAVGSLFVAITEADYVMPPFQTVVTEATSIVDATVVEVQEPRRVRIDVHEVLKGGKPPAFLSGAWLTCLGVDLSRRLEIGQRYIFLLHDGSLYEENTYYKVRAGPTGVECECWDGSEEGVRRWMPVSEFKRLLDESQRSR